MSITSNVHPSRQSRSPGRVIGSFGFATATATAAVGLSVLATPALAAVDANHTVLVSKDDSIVLAEGFEVDEPVRVAVVRDGVTIGTATGVAQELDPAEAPGVGFFEVNHAAEPTVCWDSPHTPELLPGDLVTVTSGESGREIVDTVEVSDIAVTQGPTEVAPGTVTVKGHVAGTPPPIGNLEVEVRSLDPIRFRVLAPGEGTIRYDDPVNAPGDFTATFDGLSAQQTQALLNAFEVTATHLVEENEGTVATLGAQAGSEDPSCPAVARRAVTSFSPAVLNAANLGTNLTVSGLTQDSSAVDVTLNDDDPATPQDASVTRAATVTAPDSAGKQTWTVTFTPAELAGLNGNITAVGSYVDTGTGTSLGGVANSLVKDVVAPEAPGALPGGGTYTASQAVSLTTADETDVIRYRLLPFGARVEPQEGSPRFQDQLSVTSSQTIAARVFDAAGNAGPTAFFDYTIVHAVAPGAPTEVSASRGDGQVTLTWSAPTNDGGAPITGYTIRSNSVEGQSSMTVGSVTSATFVGLTNGVPYSFDVTATNLAGSGNPSAMTGAVTPAAAPAAPTIGAAKAGNRSASVSWTAPSETGGIPLTGYVVRAFAGDSLVSTTEVNGSTTTRAEVTGLANGTAYTFEVAAVNEVGTGAASGRSTEVTPSRPAGAPTIRKAVSGKAGGRITATAKWAAPRATGGSAITGYRVFALRVNAKGAVKQTTQSKVLSAKAREFSMRLPRSGSYRFQVVAINAMGSSAKSARSNIVSGR